MTSMKTPTIGLQREGQYYSIQNLEDRGNVVFEFLTSCRKRNLWDCYVSAGPLAKRPCINKDRYDRFVAYAEKHGIKVKMS